MLNASWMIVWSALVGALAQDTGMEASEPREAGGERAAHAQRPTGEPDVHTIQIGKRTLREGLGVSKLTAPYYEGEPAFRFDLRDQARRGGVSSNMPVLPRSRPGGQRSIRVRLDTSEGQAVQRMEPMPIGPWGGTAYRVLPEGGPMGFGGVVAQTPEFTMGWWETAQGVVTIAGPTGGASSLIAAPGSSTCGSEPTDVAPANTIEEAPFGSMQAQGGGTPAAEDEPIDILFMYENDTCAGEDCKALVRLENEFGPRTLLRLGSGRRGFPVRAGITSGRRIVANPRHTYSCVMNGSLR